MVLLPVGTESPPWAPGSQTLVMCHPHFQHSMKLLPSSELQVRVTQLKMLCDISKATCVTKGLSIWGCLFLEFGVFFFLTVWSDKLVVPKKGTSGGRGRDALRASLGAGGRGGGGHLPGTDSVGIAPANCHQPPARKPSSIYLVPSRLFAA